TTTEAAIAARGATCLCGRTYGGNCPRTQRATGPYLGVCPADTERGTVEPTAGSRHGAHPEGIAVHAGDHQETHDLLAANAPSDIRCEPERNRVQHPLFYGCALLQRKHPDYQEIGSRSAGDQRRRRPDQPGSCEPPDQRDSRNARWWRCSHINGLPEWLCDAYGERQRRGDAAGGKGKDFRTLLYDKACGTRYGTWLVGSRRHRLCPWRADQRYQCARQGFAF